MQTGRWLGRWGLLMGGLALGLILAEVGFRFARPDAAADLLYNAPDNAPNGLYSTHPDLYAVPTAGFKGRQESLGYGVDLRINTHGLRGPELGAKSQPRWLASGDSFTMAAQVSEADTFAQRLGSELKVEMLNAGVDGYGTWQAMGRYQELDAALDLDGMLLTFFVGNDVHDNVRWTQVQAEAKRMRAGAPLARRPINPVHAWFYKRSALYAGVRMMQRRSALSSPDHHERHRWVSELRLFTRDGGGVLGSQLPHTDAALAALAKMMKERGDSLMVAIAPPAFQVQRERLDATFSLVGIDPSTASPDAVSDGVRSLLERRGIATCDLVPPLRRAEEAGGEMYLEYDGHWSLKGHAVVSDTLAKCMKESGFTR